MTNVRITAHFDAPVQRVFDLATDYSRYPEWNVSYEDIKQVTGPVDKVGTKIHSVMKILGRKMEGWGELVEIDRPRFIKISGTGLEGGRLTYSQRLTPAASGTDLEFECEYELPAGILGHIADRLFVEKAVERDLHHSMENFKALVEAKMPVLV